MSRDESRTKQPVRGRSLLRAALGVTVGAIVAIIGITNLGRGDEPNTPGRTPEDAASEASTSPSVVGEVEHRFPPDHAGPVWIELDAGGRAVVVTIEWGPWRRTIHHAGPQTTYRFRQDTPTDGSEIPPLAVTTAPAADVRFGYGPIAPADAQDVNAGWEPVGSG